MQHKTAFGAIAAASATAGLLLTAAPAMAQTAEDVSCDSGVLSYPPGLGGGTINSTAFVAGETLTATTAPGAFDPASSVVVTVADAATLGTVTAGPDGSASIDSPLPTSLQPGTHTVLFTGVLGGEAAAVAFCITSTAAGTPITGGVANPATDPDPAVPVVPADNTPISGGDEAPARPSALPFTGSSELVTVAGLGAALLLAGAGTVVVARRRRSEAPLAV